MSNHLTIHKWWWVWRFEEEEEWLNQMAMEGWALDRISFLTYHFVQCEPGEYTIRMEMRRFDSEYINFMEEIGAEYLGSMVKWNYFRRKSELGAFDIFSDIDSRIHHLERIGKLLSCAGLGNIVIGINNSFSTIPLGFINLLCGCLLMYGLGRIHSKEDELKKARRLHE